MSCPSPASHPSVSADSAVCRSHRQSRPPERNTTDLPSRLTPTSSPRHQYPAHDTPTCSCPRSVAHVHPDRVHHRSPFKMKSPRRTVRRLLALCVALAVVSLPTIASADDSLGKCLPNVLAVLFLSSSPSCPPRSRIASCGRPCLHSAIVIIYHVSSPARLCDK